MYKNSITLMTRSVRKTVGALSAPGSMKYMQMPTMPPRIENSISQPFLCEPEDGVHAPAVGELLVLDTQVDGATAEGEAKTHSCASQREEVPGLPRSGTISAVMP